MFEINHGIDKQVTDALFMMEYVFFIFELFTYLNRDFESNLTPIAIFVVLRFRTEIALKS